MREDLLEAKLIVSKNEDRMLAGIIKLPDSYLVHYRIIYDDQARDEIVRWALSDNHNVTLEEAQGLLDLIDIYYSKLQ